MVQQWNNPCTSHPWESKNDEENLLKVLVTIIALPVAMLLSGPARAQVGNYGIPGPVYDDLPLMPPIVVGSESVCETVLMNPKVQENKFEIGRGEADYNEILPTTKDFNVRSIYKSLGPKGILFDISAGLGRLLVDLGRVKPGDDESMPLFGASFRMPIIMGPESANMGKDVFRRLQWDMRTQSIIYYEVNWDTVTSQQLIESKVPTADFLLDIIGYWQYSQNLSHAIKRTTELTNKNGIIGAAFYETLIKMPMYGNPGSELKFLEIVDENDQPVPVNEYFAAIVGLQAIAVNTRMTTPRGGFAEPKDEIGFSGIWRKVTDDVKVPELELIGYKLREDEVLYRKYRWNRKLNKMVPQMFSNLPKYVDTRRKIPRPPPLADPAPN